MRIIHAFTVLCCSCAYGGSQNVDQETAWSFGEPLRDTMSSFAPLAPNAPENRVTATLERMEPGKWHLRLQSQVIGSDLAPLTASGKLTRKEPGLAFTTDDGVVLHLMPDAPLSRWRCAVGGQVQEVALRVTVPAPEIILLELHPGRLNINGKPLSSFPVFCHDNQRYFEERLYFLLTADGLAGRAAPWEENRRATRTVELDGQSLTLTPLSGGVPWIQILKITADTNAPTGHAGPVSSLLIHHAGRIGLFLDRTENFLRDAEYRARIVTLLRPLPWQGSLITGIFAIREQQVQGSQQSSASLIQQPLRVTPAQDGALQLQLGDRVQQRLLWHPGTGQLEAVPASR